MCRVAYCNTWAVQQGMYEERLSQATGDRRKHSHTYTPAPVPTASHVPTVQSVFVALTTMSCECLLAFSIPSEIFLNLPFSITSSSGWQRALSDSLGLSLLEVSESCASSYQLAQAYRLGRAPDH